MKRITLVTAGTLILGTATVAGCGSAEYEFEPLPPIEDYVPSEAELEQYHRALDLYAESYYGTDDPPEYEIIRWVDSDDEQAVFAECMQSLGINAVVIDENSVGYSGDPSIAEPANYQCLAQYPTRLDISRPFEAEELPALYDHIVENFIPCVEELGYVGLELSSKETFIEYATGNHLFNFQPAEQIRELYPETTPAQIDHMWSQCDFTPEDFRKIRDN